MFLLVKIGVLLQFRRTLDYQLLIKIQDSKHYTLAAYLTYVRTFDADLLGVLERKLNRLVFDFARKLRVVVVSRQHPGEQAARRSELVARLLPRSRHDDVIAVPRKRRRRVATGCITGEGHVVVFYKVVGSGCC